MKVHKKSVPDSLKGRAIPGTLFKNSESGWINGQLFIEWFQFFLQHIPPVRLVLMGMHLTFPLI